MAVVEKVRLVQQRVLHGVVHRLQEEGAVRGGAKVQGSCERHQAVGGQLEHLHPDEFEFEFKLETLNDVSP